MIEILDISVLTNSKSIFLTGIELDKASHFKIEFLDKTYQVYSPDLLDSQFCIINTNTRKSIRKITLLNENKIISSKTLLSEVDNKIIKIKRASLNHKKPLRVCFIANPFYIESGRIKRDPIIKHSSKFTNLIKQSLFDIYKREPYELLAWKHIKNATEILAILDKDYLSIPISEAPINSVLCRRVKYSSVAQIEASRRRVYDFLDKNNIKADIAIVLSLMRSCRSTGWFTTDDYSRGGKSFLFDGKKYLHSFHSTIPGVVAVAKKKIPKYELRHELIHALTSYNSGQALDEYNLLGPYKSQEANNIFSINKKYHINNNIFANYNGINYSAKKIGGGSKRRYVPVNSSGNNSIMRTLKGTPQMDDLLSKFLLDRLTTKINRKL